MAVLETTPNDTTAHLQNPTPFRPHPLTQVRAGKIKKVWAAGIDSAIYKTSLNGSVPVTNVGLHGDEHAFPPHGGIDMALLHYSSAHYPRWKEELPSSAHLFNIGGFGENLVSEEVDETTVCIGDRISIGEIVVEVGEPRAPCFKLNHRFEVKDMAKRAQTQFRTGWCYKVKKTGNVQAGDMITLIERPHPEWTVARVQHHLYIERDNKEAMEQLVALPELGNNIKKLFAGRLEKGKIEDMNGRMFGDESAILTTWSEYKLVAKRKETSTVTAFVLEALLEPKEILPVEPGSHVRLKLGGKLVRAYSVTGGTSQRFEIGVALGKDSRGGSKFLHEKAEVADILTVGRITTSFPLSKEADRHVIIAGGIGITAFLVALQYLKKTGQRYELHFAVAEEVPFKEQLVAFGDNVTIYKKSQGQRLDLQRVISRADGNTHIYCCGPQRLMDAVETTANSLGVPPTSVHFEAFTVETGGDPFTAELKESKKTIEIGSSQSLLDALRAVGMDIDSSCEVGNCGTCKVGICGGRVIHRGTGLLEHEKESTMLSCVSRGVGKIVLDL
ncbi:pyruvate kinase-like protein [Lophiotrema nucula]|uniref:Pyruvate kinase-like protein n=1 Tax=Lophiotrema nucula TaxID=690887 RepID=A0A6A5ZE57_9PLEO|nr:pyruvate kinase-like protein [Lophiotrema nucula]